MKIEIGMQENWKKHFTVDEGEAIAEMRKNNFAEISENGVCLDDFTSLSEEYILKFSLEFCRNLHANFFVDDRLNNIDIYVHVIYYDGYEFIDESYYYSDFMMRIDENFKKSRRHAFVRIES